MCEKPGILTILGSLRNLIGSLLFSAIITFRFVKVETVLEPGMMIYLTMILLSQYSCLENPMDGGAW